MSVNWSEQLKKLALDIFGRRKKIVPDRTQQIYDIKKKLKNIHLVGDQR